MLQGWVVIAVALAYIGLLFLVASYGDRERGLGRVGRTRLLIYPLVAGDLLHVVDVLRARSARPRAPATSSSPSISARC